jgi:signal transduction histidine kinase
LLTSIRLVMILLLSYVYFIQLPEDSGWLRIVVVGATLIYLFNHYQIFTNKARRSVLPFILADGLLSFLYGFLFPRSTVYLIFLGVVAVTVFIYTSNRKVLFRGSLLFFGLWIMVGIYTWKVTGTYDFISNILNISFVLFGSIVGDLIRKLLEARETMNLQIEQLHHSHEALSEANSQLQNYSKQVEELTTIRERNRIAREIHDTVGHKMTALLVQMELSKALLKIDIDKAEQTISVCESLAREALQEIRLSVRTLHQEEEEAVPFIPSIRKLLGDFYRTTSLESEFEVNGDPSLVPISLQPTIIRTIQEALTNAKRHGMANQFLLKIDCNEEAITIITKDNGKGTGLVEPGFGLINMKERIEEHGGSVLFESKAGEGFQTNIHFPLLRKAWRTGGKK